MNVVKQILGWLLLPFKLVFELLDPVLRFIEMSINIPLAYVIGGIVNLINLIPCVHITYEFDLHIGELVLSILSAVAFALLNIFVFHFPIHTAFIVLICIGIAIVGYFILYFIIHILINFVTSIVSFIIVFFRISIYLPGSIWMTLIKLVVPPAIWAPIFIIYYDFWTMDVQHIIYSVLILLGIMAVVSIIMLAIRNDIKIHHMGSLDSIELEDLSAFTHSIGLYVMTYGSIPVYIGRAVEYNNGGLRKRIRDYLREANSHTSGVFIQKHKSDLDLTIIEMGHTEEDVDRVKYAETSMISSIFTKLNDKDAIIAYAINIIGYVLGGIAACALAYVFLGRTIPAFVVMAYAVIVVIVCIVFYCLQTSKKKYASHWSAW